MSDGVPDDGGTAERAESQHTDHDFDWEAFWTEDLTPFDREHMLDRAHDAARMLGDLFQSVGVPERVCSVGCGPAVCLLDLADWYPGVTFVGVDRAATALERARAARDERGLDNVSFVQSALPDLAGVEGEFDLVYCFGTLDYVPDVRGALRSLFDCVAPGGRLVVNYPTPERQRWHAEHLDDPGDYHLGDHDEAWLRRRLRLVDEGVTTITPAEVGETLDRDPVDVWDLVDPGSDRESEPEVPITVLRR